ncbi:MAG TPA: SO_0444 family Cu/Zn efflux transporter [Sedimentisphaerales bacterium]|nr:SO_0444 family Cu/Zn efflux transporter [Sedimentisphaerales bacterium]
MADFAKSIIIDFWGTAAEMSPYLLFGFFVAGILSVFVSQPLVERHLGGRGVWPLVKASIVGVPLPLCSCGVIPVSISLHKHGASKGATVSFLLSTPQTGVDSIFVTLSLLGPVFAVFRPLAAFVTGIIGGTLVDVFNRDKNNAERPQPECKDECCAEGNKKNKIIKGLKYGFVTLPRDIGKAMLVGLIIAAFISALIPDGYFAEKLGTGIFAMVVMMFLGIPVYVCATASVPVAAALILKGLTPGAALVFLMTGPATNAASFITIWKALGRTTAITYLATVAGCSLLFGILLDYIASGIDIEIATHHGWMLPDFVKYISAVALLAILSFAILSKRKGMPDEQ